MTYLKIRPYVPEDFLNIELMEYERKCREGQPVERWAIINYEAGPAWTVVAPDGEIVFCCGLRDMWTGVAEIWAVFSPAAKKYPGTLMAAKSLMKSAWRMGYDRIQAALDPVGCPEAIRFDEKLGFSQEGILRRYGPHGEDRIMYAALRGDCDGK